MQEQTNIESINIPELIKFVKQKDYKFVKQLGRGGCGITILLLDEIINENFVCKKYAPFDPEDKEELFKKFKEEIRLLYLLFHKNIVRIFNYHIYDEHKAGYIIMEFIEGNDIETYLEIYPENINDIFLQVIEGFSYLEKMNILHRDIRPQNIMVNKDGLVKIIDFGFGKQISNNEDFDKSISLNWWCDVPSDFQSENYNFKTEIYFIGKLFEQIIQNNSIESFAYKRELSNMCRYNHDERISSFANIKQGILQDQFLELPFSDEERDAYRYFADSLSLVINTVKPSTEYYDEIDEIQIKLEELYKKVMLEEDLPKNTFIINCFLKGGYNYWQKRPFPTYHLKKFIELLRAASKEKKNIILSNLHSRFEGIDRSKEDLFDDEIPF